MESRAEEWLPVVGWEGLYEVSSRGRVRSLDRMVGSKHGSMRPIRGRLLSAWAHCANKYLMVCLSGEGRGGNNGQRKNRPVHQLVAEAFIGPRPEGMEVCHNDGVHENNSLENLRYDTRAENIRDSYRHGRVPGPKPGPPRTYCVHGHEMTPENSVPRPGGRNPQCRECQRAANRNYHHRVRKHRGRKRISEVAPGTPGRPLLRGAQHNRNKTLQPAGECLPGVPVHETQV